MRLLLSVILVLFGTCFFLLADWYPEAAWLQLEAVRIGLPVILVIPGLGLIILSGRLMPRDPNLLAWAILGSVGSFLLVPLLIAKNQQVAVNARAQALVQEQHQQLIQELRRQQQLQLAAEADRRERMKDDRFVQYEGRIPADQLDALRALDKRMQEAVKERSRQYMEALDSHPTKGLATWVLSRSAEELEAQISAHAALYAETRAFTSFVESFEDDYSSQIEQLQLRPPADRIAIAEMERVLQQWERTNVYKLRQLDVRFLGEALKALNILRDAWGNWSFDPRTNLISFVDPQVEHEFQLALLHIHEIQKELESFN